MRWNRNALAVPIMKESALEWICPAMLELESISQLLHLLLRPVTLIFTGSERLYWFYLLTAFLIAALLFVRTQRRHPEQVVTLKGLWEFCFPAKVYGHPSARNDVLYFFVNSFVLFFLLIPLTSGFGLAVSGGVQGILDGTAFDGVLGQSPIIASVLYTLCLAVLIDFTLFITHYIQHKVPWLWEFHKVHHSAEVLQPLTVYRMHPVDDLMTYALTAMVSGLVDGVFQTLFQGPIGIIGLYGLNVFLLAFYAIGYHLRHSHIWLDYGPLWGRIFISPAQHQIHHSQAPRHYDKNMGFIFAWWDEWFGTLYVPKKREELTFGINQAGEHKEYGSLAALYGLPFCKVARHIPQPVLVVLAALLLGGGAMILWLPDRSPSASVYLEELTWREVRDRVQQGDTIAIVPTGGTEQNGPHMILGKHNYIVRHTAGEIARRLGHTLVAPVLAYVPEGEVDPPSGHMRFAGTLSVPEEVFEATLESAARSLKTHGFRLICFLGDSGGNQASQAKVADKLNREWRDSGVTVLHVGDYYLKNKQVDWLLSAGETVQDIGSHAGIRDTSELMVVFSQGIRRGWLMNEPQAKMAHPEVIGNPARASAETGKTLLELKIQAAVRQIQPVYRALPTSRLQDKTPQ